MKLIILALIPIILSIGIFPAIPFIEAAEFTQICIDKVWIESEKGRIACVTSSTAEKLVGHRVYRDEENNIVDLDDSYNVPTLEILFGQYKTALSELAIDNMTRVQIKELQIQKQYSSLEEEKRKHFEEKKKWYKTIIDRAKTDGEIPVWLRPVMDEMIQDFES